MGQGSPIKLVIAYGNAESVKRGEKAQRKQMGQGCPRKKQKGTQEPIKTNGHVRPLEERINGRPKEAKQD